MFQTLCSCFGRKAQDEGEGAAGLGDDQAPLVQESLPLAPEVLVSILKKPQKDDGDDNDSGACVDEATVKPESLENVPSTINNLELSPDITPDLDQVQLTVSSVNTLLEDLPEVEVQTEAKIGSAIVTPLSDVPEDSTQPLTLHHEGSQISVRSRQSNRFGQQSGNPDTRSNVSKSSATRLRHKSPCVSFDDNPVTIVPNNTSRQRSKSDATRFKFRSPSSSFSSIGSRAKMTWLRDRQKLTRLPELQQPGMEELEGSGRDGMIEEIETGCGIGTQGTKTDPWKGSKKSALAQPSTSTNDIDKPMLRPRTKSDKLDRRSKKAVVAEVSKTSAFDWPLGRLGKLRQIYRARSGSVSTSKAKTNKPRSLGPKSTSELALTAKEIEHFTGTQLKRRLSDKSKAAKGKAGGDNKANPSLALSFWHASLRFLWGETGRGSRSRRRRRYTDGPCKPL